MFKVGDLAVVASPATDAATWPDAAVGDVVQITRVYNGGMGEYVGVLIMRTGATSNGWVASRFDPLLFTPSNNPKDTST